MEYDLKFGVQGHVYFPKKFRQVFGEKLKFLPNQNAAVLYPENMDPDVVIASLRVIISDLKLRSSKKEPPQGC